MSCARSFGAVLELTDLELCLFQEAITIGTASKELHEYISDAVAYLSGLMTTEQREWRGYDRWLRVMMDFAIFGSEENPIEVED